MSNSYIQMSNDHYIPPQIFLSLAQTGEGIDSLLKKEGERKEYEYLPEETHINFINRNWDNVDKLNEKFNELRRKEIEEKITMFEKCLLYDVIEIRILEFPNPYLPKDHEEGMKLVEKYSRIEKRFDRKYKRNRISKLFNMISSWLF